ncbi:MAG: agmatine deiminase family protein [Thermoanaerobaculales bacterium]|nr:agmatine deiminase family protein [Thermoanaerobaculales bacterium]
MNRLLCCVVVLVGIAIPGFAEEMVIVPREVLDTIVSEVENPLPRYATPEELAMPPLELPKALLAPPPGEIDCPSEYAHNAGVLYAWGYYNSLVTAMTVPITTGDSDGIVHLIVWSASQQASATATLSGAGADMSQVNFILADTDTVWIRDYGPRFISEDGERAVIDHTYNRTRPNDNQIPDQVAALWSEASYDIGLTHGGGNFHLFDDDEAFMTELILDENSGLSEAEVEQRYLDYQGLDLTVTDALPTWFDSTQHIDMWMLPVADREVIIGEYTAGTTAHTVTETWVTELANRGYTIHRTPGWDSGGTHYTYTNAVVFNEIVFMPEFSVYPTENAQALAVFQAAFPGRTIIPVDCSSIIHSAGAIHCITMHVPDVEAIFVNGFEAGSTGMWADTAS